MNFFVKQYGQKVTDDKPRPKSKLVWILVRCEGRRRSQIYSYYAGARTISLSENRNKACFGFAERRNSAIEIEKV